jgi:hypothetical protein
VWAAYAELGTWRPFLKRFPGWKSKFVHRSFWPSTVITAEAARSIIRLCDENTELQEILGKTRIVATEEVVLPTLVALLGFRVWANPCSSEFVRPLTRYSVAQIDAAMGRANVFWAHPIPRRHEDPLRKRIRSRFSDYCQPAAAPAVPIRPSSSFFAVGLRILARMRAIEGWLEDAEAELLIGATVRALTSSTEPCAVVEVGSYCGRRTVVLGSVILAVRPEARLFSVDPHDGKFGSADRYITMGPSLEKLEANIAAAGLAEVVQIVQAAAPQVPWHEHDPIALLVIDGLHDYASVARDFRHFGPRLLKSGYVAFHGYGSYFSGVAIFVDELLAMGEYHKVDAVGSMIVLQKT